jgi:hypothetical protein
VKTVSLANKRRYMLPPIHVPEAGLVSVITGVNVRDKRTGAVGRQKLQRNLPRAYTLTARGTPGDRVDGLPEGAAHSSEVLTARSRGDIDIIIADNAPAGEPPPAPPTATSNETPAGAAKE